MDLKTFNPNGVGVDNGAYYGLPFTPCLLYTSPSPRD